MEEKLCIWATAIVITIALVVSHSLDDSIDPNTIIVDGHVYELTSRG